MAGRSANPLLMMTNPDRTSRAPYFLITIDTEGDNQWDCPPETTTRNSRFLPRFQQVCEKYGLKPTYLTNYEMARCTVFQEFARDVLVRGTAEIGMHLHAWDMPPDHSLTSDDRLYHPYLIEYPDEILRAKVALMTDLLEQTFQVKMRSHRAGRWAMDERYAAALIDLGYQVDCSVTPFVSWRSNPGDPSRRGGVDYSRFPAHAYFVDPEEISRPGDSPLLEVPMTILPENRPFAVTARRGFYEYPRPVRTVISRICPVNWLRPNGKNLTSMVSLLRQVRLHGGNYAEFMLHSSELMPGGSPTFRTDEDIERLYDHLEELFQSASQHYSGGSLAEYYAFHTTMGGGGMARDAGEENVASTSLFSTYLTHTKRAFQREGT